MASTIIQFRVDESIKNEASRIYDELGVDLSTAIRTFLKRSIKANGYPFDMIIKNDKNDEAMKAFRSLQAQARINGLSDMTIEDIDAEIAAARKERK